MQNDGADLRDFVVQYDERSFPLADLHHGARYTHMTVVGLPKVAIVEWNDPARRAHLKFAVPLQQLVSDAEWNHKDFGVEYVASNESLRVLVSTLTSDGSSKVSERTREIYFHKD